ncbi:MAG: SAM-dependent chlorinase/fluorinase [bacterium]|nr:SAM-dependent chlorinase/fluorinase [bacterium]
MVIAILTDFGLEDAYVGIMKGVMLKTSPKLQFVDITHSIPQGDIKKAAFRLFTAYKYFPANTIFLVIVDPGVGTNRLPIIVKTNDYYFVGPDNGVFSWIYAYEKCKVHKIKIGIPNGYRQRASYKIKSIPKNISNTFHGRDVFAPIASELSKGIKITQLGEELNKWVSFKINLPQTSKNTIEGEIIDIDGFGNLITNVESAKLSGKVKVMIKGHTIIGLEKSYTGISPIAIKGSTGFLEISLPNSNCAKKLNARVGTKICINLH